MAPYGPMRRMQKHSPRANTPPPPSKEQAHVEEPVEPVKKKAKQRTGYYRYVLDLHKSVSARIKDTDSTMDEDT